MAVTFVLVERTPYLLRYLATQIGGALTDPEVVTIPNAGGASPDLRTDADLVPGTNYPIDLLVSFPVVDQFGARRLLNSDSLTAINDNPIGVPPGLRGRLRITGRNDSAGPVARAWSVDANLGIGPSAGFAVVQVYAPILVGAEAYVEIICIPTNIYD